MILDINYDLFEYLILHIDINEYNKLKKVCRIFNNVFDLGYLIDNSLYNKLIHIKGCTEKNILNIIERTILSEYNFRKNKNIIKKLLKYSNSTILNVCICSHFNIVIQYLIEIIYNTSYKKYKNLINIFDKINYCINTNIILTDDKDYYEISTFIKFCFNIINIYDNYSNNTSIIYKLNIGIYIFMLIKKINNSLEFDENKSKLNEIIILQNQKINEYKDLLSYQYYYKLIPNYYSNYIINLLNNLYI